MATLTIKVEDSNGDIRPYYVQKTLSPDNLSEHKISINNTDGYITVPLTFPTTVERIHIITPASGITTFRTVTTGPVNHDLPLKAGELSIITFDSAYAATIVSFAIANSYTAEKQIVDIRVYSA